MTNYRIGHFEAGDPLEGQRFFEEYDEKKKDSYYAMAMEFNAIQVFTGGPISLWATSSPLCLNDQRPCMAFTEDPHNKGLAGYLLNNLLFSRLVQ